MTLLNNGSFGACPKPVFEVYQRWQAEFEEHPGGFMHRWTDLMLEGARAWLSTCTPTSRLAFVTNATMGVNVVTHSLRSWLKPGDEVLTTNHEYGACNHAWQFNPRQGWRRVHQPSHRSAHPLRRAVHRAVLGRRHPADTGDLPQPYHVAHRTHLPAGGVVPAGARGRHSQRHRRRDVPGQRDLFLDDLGADFYTGNGHKWMCSPMGTAFLYVRPEVQHLIEPIIVGHGWFPDKVSEKPLVDYVESYGTCDLSGFLAVPAAIDYMEAHDWPAGSAATQWAWRQSTNWSGTSAPNRSAQRLSSGSVSLSPFTCPTTPTWASWARSCARNTTSRCP
ncbi:MAG: aminotransferase class V-fold PLP-dependent enzyme [Caldilineaceae bacterium]